MIEDKKRRSLYSSVIIGSMTGGIEAFLTNPLVTVKTCLQKDMPIPWRDWLIWKKPIIKNFGAGMQKSVRFLYRGTNAHVSGMGLSIGIRMATRDSIATYLYKDKKLTFQQQIFAAYAGGFVSAYLITPMELGMTLQQTASPYQRAPNLLKVLKEVKDKWGVKKGLTGFTCVSMRDGLMTTGFLTFTPMFKKYISGDNRISDQTATLVTGTAIGTVFSIASHPLDTIKAIQQTNLRDSKNVNAHNLRFAAKQIFQDSGLKGFYRGLFFRTLRVGPHVGIISTISDKLTRMTYP